MAYSKNLGKVANLIVNAGWANVVWVGDSTGSDSNSPRWAQGIRRRWPVKWIGKFVPADTQAPAEVGSVFPNVAVPITLRSPGATMSDGATVNPLALNMGDEAFAANYAAFSVFLRHVLTNMQSHGLDVPGGSPFATNWANGNTLRARYIVLIPNTPANALEYANFITQTGGVDGTGSVLQPQNQSAGIWTVEKDCVAGTSSTDEYEAHTRAYWAVDETGRKHYQAGVLFYIPAETTGFQFQSISTGGWSTTDHLSPLNSGGDAAYYDADGKYTQAQLTAALTALRAPNVAFIQLGINRSTGENGGDESHLLAHQAYIEKIALRYREAMLAAGATDPQVVLVTHWQVADDTSSNQTWASGKAAKYAELCDDYDWLAMADLNGVLIAEDGTYTDWNATYLADTIHQTEDGVVRFAEILWDLLEGALAPGGGGAMNLEGGTMRGTAGRIS